MADYATEGKSGFVRTTVIPLVLLLTTPPLIALLWMTCTRFDGSILRLLTEASPALLLAGWPGVTTTAGAIIAVFVAVEVTLLLLLPGATHLGPVTPSGDRPAYRLNGVPAFLVTHALFFGATLGLRWFPGGIVYDNYGDILTTLTVFALLLCLGLYFKGRYFPSSADHGLSGNFIQDYYWGVELHPRIGRIDLKQLTNCRLGMMGWSVILDGFLLKQYESTGHVATSMLVSFALQQAYILKFFVWESGYFATLDIMHDRAGYYIVWGVLCWIPGVYTLVGLYLVNHPHDMSPAIAALLLLMGTMALLANYDADAQRQRVRATGGATRIWGRKPEVMIARYVTADGQPRESLLLLSGWWGLSRHAHYVTELTLALCWSLPAGVLHLVPYTYLIFLTILLFDRSGRDEHRCRAKYGDDWREYCRRVPWRIVPGIY